MISVYENNVLECYREITDVYGWTVELSMSTSLPPTRFSLLLSKKDIFFASPFHPLMGEFPTVQISTNKIVDIPVDEYKAIQGLLNNYNTFIDLFHDNKVPNPPEVI